MFDCFFSLLSPVLYLFSPFYIIFLLFWLFFYIAVSYLIYSLYPFSSFILEFLFFIVVSCVILFYYFPCFGFFLHCCLVCNFSFVFLSFFCFFSLAVSCVVSFFLFSLYFEVFFGVSYVIYFFTFVFFFSSFFPWAFLSIAASYVIALLDFPFPHFLLPPALLLLFVVSPCLRFLCIFLHKNSEICVHVYFLSISDPNAYVYRTLHKRETVFPLRFITVFRFSFVTYCLFSICNNAPRSLIFCFRQCIKVTSYIGI